MNEWLPYLSELSSEHRWFSYDVDFGHSLEVHLNKIANEQTTAASLPNIGTNQEKGNFFLITLIPVVVGKSLVEVRGVGPRASRNDWGRGCITGANGSNAAADEALSERLARRDERDPSSMMSTTTQRTAGGMPWGETKGAEGAGLADAGAPPFFAPFGLAGALRVLFRVGFA